MHFVAPELFGCLEDAVDPRPDEPVKTQVYAFGCLYYEVSHEHADLLTELSRFIMTVYLWPMRKAYKSRLSSPFSVARRRKHLNDEE
jgi:hypothetical protein